MTKLKVEYNDESHYDQSKSLTLDEALEGLAHKMYGEDLRYALIEFSNRIVELMPTDDGSGEEKDKFKQLEERINRIVLGTDTETTELIVRKILKDEGVIK